MDLRQIDVLVAEKVLQWKRGRTEYGEMPWKAPDGKGYLFVPRFSSDIAATWQVVEKMRERETYIAVECHPNYWRAVVYDGNWYFELSEHADTAPLAICLAALRTVGVEVPEGECRWSSTTSRQ